MTEDQELKILEVKNSFWEKLGHIAAEHIAMMPEEMEGHLTAELQDSCSIYGTRYDEHLPGERAALRDGSHEKPKPC